MIYYYFKVIKITSKKYKCWPAFMAWQMARWTYYLNVEWFLQVGNLSNHFQFLCQIMSYFLIHIINNWKPQSGRLGPWKPQSSTILRFSSGRCRPDWDFQVVDVCRRATFVNFFITPHWNTGPYKRNNAQNNNCKRE